MKKGVSRSRVESFPLESLAGPLPLLIVSGVGLLVTGPRHRQYKEEEEVVRARLAWGASFYSTPWRRHQVPCHFPPACREGGLRIVGL